MLLTAPHQGAARELMGGAIFDRLPAYDLPPQHLLVYLQSTLVMLTNSPPHQVMGTVYANIGLALLGAASALMKSWADVPENLCAHLKTVLEAAAAFLVQVQDDSGETRDDEGRLLAERILSDLLEPGYSATANKYCAVKDDQMTSAHFYKQARAAVAGATAAGNPAGTLANQSVIKEVLATLILERVSANLNKAGSPGSPGEQRKGMVACCCCFDVVPLYNNVCVCVCVLFRRKLRRGGGARGGAAGKGGNEPAPRCPAWLLLVSEPGALPRNGLSIGVGRPPAVARIEDPQAGR